MLSVYRPRLQVCHFFFLHPQSIALCLSFLLLKATLANHVVFSDASKAANYKEMSSKLKVDRLELKKGRLEVKLHK
jgi:hypothetical protein